MKSYAYIHEYLSWYDNDDGDDDDDDDDDDDLDHDDDTMDHLACDVALAQCPPWPDRFPMDERAWDFLLLASGHVQEVPVRETAF